MTTQSLGHDAHNARDIGLGTAADADIAARAIVDRAVLVTRDFDFADVRNYPPARYHGIVVLDLADDAPAATVCALLDSFLRQPRWLSSLPGRLAIVRPNRVRFRPPLEP